jgi:hypothetical protein
MFLLEPAVVVNFRAEATILSYRFPDTEESMLLYSASVKRIHFGRSCVFN